MSEPNYFDDLSDYSYQIAPYTFPGVKSVGWLNLNEKFSVGKIPAGTFNKLKSITQRQGPFRPLVEPIRELPSCQICGELKMLDPAGYLVPNAEIWIPAGETIYASPTAMLHYIEVHGYLPPRQYLDAIDALDPSVPFDGNEIYRRKLDESGWVYKPE